MVEHSGPMQERILSGAGLKLIFSGNVPKYQNRPQLTPESVLKDANFFAINHKRECQKIP